MGESTGQRVLRAGRWGSASRASNLALYGSGTAASGRTAVHVHRTRGAADLPCTKLGWPPANCHLRRYLSNNSYRHLSYSQSQSSSGHSTTERPSRKRTGKGFGQQNIWRRGRLPDASDAARKSCSLERSAPRLGCNLHLIIEYQLFHHQIQIVHS